MTHPLVAIEERAHVNKFGFKAFHTIKEAITFIQKHEHWSCKLYKKTYDARTVRYVVNYQK